MIRASLVGTILFALLTACADKNTDSEESKGPSFANPVSFELPRPDYPAALIFEGGRGDPWMDKSGTQHEAQWRLYLCFQRTSQTPLQQEMMLNFNELPNPLQFEITDKENQSRQLFEKLNQVRWIYTYSTRTSEDPKQNYGYAYGDVALSMRSEQKWHLVDPEFPSRPVPQASIRELDFLDLELGYGSVTHFSQMVFKINGENHYISKTLERFTYSQKDRQSNVIEACEEAKAPFVLQMGSELRNLPFPKKSR